MRKERVGSIEERGEGEIRERKDEGKEKEEGCEKEQREGEKGKV